MVTDFCTEKREVNLRVISADKSLAVDYVVSQGSWNTCSLKCTWILKKIAGVTYRVALDCTPALVVKFAQCYYFTKYILWIETVFQSECDKLLQLQLLKGNTDWQVCVEHCECSVFQTKQNIQSKRCNQVCRNKCMQVIEMSAWNTVTHPMLQWFFFFFHPSLFNSDPGYRVGANTVHS